MGSGIFTYFGHMADIIVIHNFVRNSTEKNKEHYYYFVDTVGLINFDSFRIRDDTLLIAGIAARR